MTNYLTPQQIADLLGVQKATFLRYYSTRPDFPLPYTISRKNKLWKEVEVNDYILRQRRERIQNCSKEAS